MNEVITPHDPVAKYLHLQSNPSAPLNATSPNANSNEPSTTITTSPVINGDSNAPPSDSTIIWDLDDNQDNSILTNIHNTNSNSNEDNTSVENTNQNTNKKNKKRKTKKKKTFTRVNIK